MSQITQSQAEEISSALMEQESARALQEKSESARPAPRIYLCQELRKLEPHEQSSVVLEAKAAVSRDWRVILVSIIWVGLFVAFWWFVGRQHLKGAGIFAIVVIWLSCLSYFKLMCVRGRARHVAIELLRSRRG